MTRIVPQGSPPGFQDYEYKKSWLIPQSKEAIWAWLNRPETFTESQIPPYRVEFVAAGPEEPVGFYEGGLNIHHGPLLLASGQLGEIREKEYRDLQYFYGSYVISLRLVRPTRLQFWLKEISHNQTEVTVQLDASVKQWFLPSWKLGSKVFWGFFGFWMQRLNDYSLG